MICRNDHGRAYICSSLLYYYNADQSFAGEEKLPLQTSEYGKRVMWMIAEDLSEKIRKKMIQR